jgi:hypothetical protein
MEDESLMTNFVNMQVKNRLRAAEIDAEINGGALVEVARVYGKPLYMRVDHHDPEKAKHELEEIQSVIKSIVITAE